MAVRENPTARGLILLNHGLVTWGESVEASYRSHIRLVTQAEDYVTRRNGCKRVFAARPRVCLEPDSRRIAAGRIAPIIRGALSREERVIARYTDDPRVLDFVGDETALRASLEGAATPDHILSTKNWPVWVETSRSDRHRGISERPDPITRRLRETISRVRGTLAARRADTSGYAAGGAGARDRHVDNRQGCGLRTDDCVRYTFIQSSIIASAEGVSRYRSLSEEEVFRAEYWPLELYKLTLVSAGTRVGPAGSAGDRRIERNR